MNRILARLPLIALGAPAALMLLAVPACAEDGTMGNEPTHEAEPADGSFTSDNDAAMAKMMKDMHVPPTGDADRDFLVMMIPHHQGAVDMARAQIRYGANPRLKELSRKIIAAQEAEISYMREMLAATPAPAPSEQQGAHHHHDMNM